jgi:Na+-translocating ferredoxin:NAD+ oxidoreductase subunit G
MAANPDASARRSAWTALVLTVGAAVAFGLVAFVHGFTRDRIAANAHARALARFDEVLAGRIYDNDLLADTVTIHDPESRTPDAAIVVHRARRNGSVVVVVMEQVATDGYSGPIRVLVAIEPAGTVHAARVLQHRETPGLGDFIDASKSDWISSFQGRSLQAPIASRWRVRKDGGDFDQYTGATVTSRALVGVVARSLALFEQHRDELLASPGTIAP